MYASDLKNVQKELDTIIPFARIFEEDPTTIRENRGKINNEIINDENIDELSIKGKSGTALLIDSFKCYHAGGHCKSKPRILLRIL